MPEHNFLHNMQFDKCVKFCSEELWDTMISARDETSLHEIHQDVQVRIKQSEHN